MSIQYLRNLPIDRANGSHRGLPSVCSAHPVVIEAALLEGLASGMPVLIEATCNQVNQEGGYTGMTPADFRRFVENIANRIGFDIRRLVLGGDHLGPNPWKWLPSEEAMMRAEAMIDAYVRAGFTKIHLDTSMGCLGEQTALSDTVTAVRAARLASVSERAAQESGFEGPVYIIGTEVPIPGGTVDPNDHLQMTTAHAAIETAEIHRKAFSSLGLDAAFERVIGIVVQPGVEFGNENVHRYDRVQAKDLSVSLKAMPQFVFEAHSTDYQSPQVLRELVEDGFAILKVGPAATFALRQALYGLDRIATFLDRLSEEDTLLFSMERLMMAEAKHWQKYYHGNDEEQYLQRHFSYSDRIRYYWPHADAVAAVGRLMKRLGGRRVPETLVGQYLADLYPDVAAGHIEATAEVLVLEAVRKVAKVYNDACV